MKGKPKTNNLQGGARNPRKRKTMRLPRGWRQRVVQMLKEQGITIHPQTITNVLNGTRENLDLAVKIEQCRARILKEQQLAARRLQKLRRAA